MKKEEVLLKKQPLKIQIDGNMPPEICTLVLSHIQKLEGVFPPWLEILVLKYDPLQQAEAAVRTNYNSRWAEMIITGETLASEEIRELIAHEIIHVLLSPFSDPLDWIMEEVIKQEAGPVAHKIASKHLEAAKEQATEDLSRAMCRLMDRESSISD